MIRVLIADDHAVARRGLRELAAEAFADAGVDTVEVADGHAAVARLAEAPFDLAVVDVRMPGPRVVELVATLREVAPAVPVLVVTALDELDIVLETMRAGASGVVHKHRDADELVDAMRIVIDGGTWLHPETSAEVAAALRAPPQTSPHDALSPRELEVMRLIGVGRSVKEAGAALGISDKTVSTYLARIRDKTGLTSHVDIARYALRHGLVE
ncbi:MAG: response regulator transcription factor [Myxococcales bacterium]|nr:response regulator transcription factor [Myxococcales bacterium]MCB9735306.1 response regulator transcription factor [Deltaproteobacteria bacterium]